MDKQALIADVLLYDRLVFPVLSGEGERTRWRQQGWDPEDQESVIEDLGADLAVTAQWDKYRQDQYEDLRKVRRQITAEASEA